MYLPPFVPRIVIRKVSEGQFKWFLFLSPNKDRPTTVSPIVYKQAFKCRESAYEFAKKLRGPIRLRDNCEKTYELMTEGEVTVIDESKIKTAPNMVGSI